ncbi:MAG: hypothetical protein ACHQ52_03570 [Candidatus Eisenbacteria bacterium]
MDRGQRRAIAVAAYAIAGVLLVFFFARPLWQWATWDSRHGTLDLGFVRVTTRPDFPGDAKAIILGLILPIVLAAAGRVIEAPPPR